jgi:beta-mannan synthase
MAAAAAEWLSRHDESLLLLRRWRSGGGAAAVAVSLWDAARSAAVAPALAAASWACLALSAMLLTDAVFLAAASLARRRRYPEGPLGCGGEDEENGRGGYPMVLVQIPMYNEREVRTH